MNRTKILIKSSQMAFMLILSILVLGISAILSLELFNHLYNYPVVNLDRAGLVQVGDTYDKEKGIYSFFDEPDSLDTLKKVYDLLNSNAEYNYYEIMSNYVEYNGHCTMAKEFFVNPENCNDTSTGKELTPLLALQLSNVVMNDLGVFKYMETGSSFDKEDYELMSLKQVPVILGNQYKEYFNLGDSFLINYLGEPLQCYVKGFFGEHAELCVGELRYDLDYYIVLPAFEKCNLTDEEFEKILYSLKCSCYLEYKNDKQIKGINELIESIRQNTGYHIDSWILNTNTQLAVKLKIFRSFLGGNHVKGAIGIEGIMMFLVFGIVGKLEQRFIGVVLSEREFLNEIDLLNVYTKLAIMFLLELIMSYSAFCSVFGRFFGEIDLKFLIQSSKCIAFYIFLTFVIIYISVLRRHFRKNKIRMEEGAE